MSERTSYTREEWALLADAPLAAAAAVALAEEGGGYREAAAIVSGWREAARAQAASPLIAALAAEMDPEDRDQSGGVRAEGAPPPDFDRLCDEAVDMCMRAADLVEERAPGEADSYRAFVMQILGRVAEASGGGLFGGERVSRSERSVMREIAAALRYRG